MPAAASEPLSPIKRLTAIILRLETHKIAPWIGLRNAAGVVLPLLLGLLTDRLAYGLAVSIGALNVSFSDSHEPYAVRGRRMAAASAAVAAAVAAGTLSSSYPVAAVANAGAWALAAGLLVSLGTGAADIGLITLVTLLVFAGQPRPAESAGLLALLAFGGGLLQTALALLSWPVLRYGAERRALGELYAELSRTATDPARSADAPPGTPHSIDAQNILSSLAGDHSAEGERLRYLLAQAERIRLSLLMVARLRARLAREFAASPVASLQGGREAVGRLLAEIGRSLQEGGAPPSAREVSANLASIADDLRAASEDAASETGAFRAALLQDTASHVDSLAGQLRAATELSPAPDAAREIAARASEPWQLRLRGALAILRANLTLESAAFRHAVRLAVCVAAGDGLARGLGTRFYWLPMTTAIVLRPDFTATFGRGVLRLAGTFLGLATATFLFRLYQPSPAAQILFIGIWTYALRAFGPANYGIFAIAITGLVVLLTGLGGAAVSEVIAERGLDTVLGGGLALLAYWAWPTWERTQVRSALAAMLDAYRLYFRKVRDGYLTPDIAPGVDLERARQAARVARTNASGFDRPVCERAGRVASNACGSERTARKFPSLCECRTGSRGRSHPYRARPGSRSVSGCSVTRSS